MNLSTLYLAENNCYKSGKRHEVKGIMVHSTGANNPQLSRYLEPDDGIISKKQKRQPLKCSKARRVKCMRSRIYWKG